jgi:hypothetical protein
MNDLNTIRVPVSVPRPGFRPSGAHWMRYGERLARVFSEYFDAVKP